MDDSQLNNSMWRVKDNNGFEGLTFEQNVPLEQLDSHACMVKIEAASLNFRDLMVAQVHHKLTT